MGKALDVTLPVNPELTRAAHSRLEDFASASALPQRVLFAVDTALEELLQNVLDHSDAREVQLRMEVDGSVLRMVLADNGRPFNPLEAAEPHLGQPLEVRELGGLGLFMARRMMDSMRYEHRDGRNRVLLSKAIG